MRKKVIVSGLLGGVVLLVWMFVVNGILGFKSRVDMKPLPGEREVYEVLKGNVIEPGRYVCNPEPTPTGFPGGEPVFGILYGGVGHEFAGTQMLFQLPVFFLASIIAAWMLSIASNRILSSYPRKVLFFAMIGLLMAVFNHLMNFGIGSYPLNDALLLAVHDILVWTLIGVVVAWRLQVEPTTDLSS